MESLEDKSIQFLVVDDQFNVRRMIHNFLRAFGYHRVIEAPDGAAALEKLRANTVDFIICDWNMPRMTGLEFLKSVRADPMLRETPFLMVTAEVAEDIVAEAIEEGVDDYIAKPFQANMLQQKLESILSRRLNPSPVEAALMAGRACMSRGRLDDALRCFETALADAPKSPRTLVALGETLEAMQREDAALERYNQAASLSSRFVKAHDKLATLYKKRGQTDMAIKHLAQAAKISPRNCQRQLDLGKTLIEEGHVDAGKAALAKAQQNAADNPEVSVQVGEIMLQAGLNDEAAEAFSNAVNLNPQMVHVYNRLGIAYRRRKRFDEAIEAFERALTVVPDEENLYFNMALALVEANRLEDARKALQNALKLQPDFKEAKALLAKIP